MHKIDNILIPGFNIVCDLTKEQRESLELELCNIYPDFKTVISDKFKTKKFGPFSVRNKQTVEDFLLSNNQIKKHGNKHIDERLTKFGIFHTKSEKVNQLSQPVQELIQLIWDSAEGRMHYLFNKEKLMQSDISIMDWLFLESEFTFEAVFVVLTEESFEKCSDIFGKSKYIKGDENIFKIENGELVNHKKPVKKTVVKKSEPETSYKPRTSVGAVNHDSLKSDKKSETKDEIKSVSSPAETRLKNISKEKPVKAKVIVCDVLESGSMYVTFFKLLDGEVVAPGTYISAETGIVYKAQGAMMLNKGDNPEDFVRIFNEKDKYFRAFLVSDSKTPPVIFEEMYVY